MNVNHASDMGGFGESANGGTFGVGRVRRLLELPISAGHRDYNWGLPMSLLVCCLGQHLE